MKKLEIAEIIYIVYRALLGRVTENLRAASLFNNEDAICIYLSFENAPSIVETELVRKIEDSIVSDLSPLIHNVKVLVEVIPYPQKIRHGGRWIYHRYEENSGEL